MNANFNRTTVKIGAMLVFAALVLSGCSSNPMSTATDDAEPRLLTRAPEYTAGKTLTDADLYLEEVVPANTGGRLELFDVVMDVPAGAVDNDTLFSIIIPDINVFYNEFGTDGLVFNTPVTVTMSYREADLSGVDESTIRIAWLNEATGLFEAVPCAIDFERRVVTAELSHFSAYGLITDE